MAFIKFWAAIIGVGLCSLGYAGQGWFVTVENNTNNQLTMVHAGSTCWYWNGIESENDIPPKSSKRFYTEADNSGSCSGSKSIAGVNVIGNGPIIHIEFKGNAGNFGGTIKTIKTCGGDNQSVGVDRKLTPGNGYSIDCQPGTQESATITAYPM
ncbi:hypothetical protein JOS77_30825 [Chromobacterium haemolyticum]|nr:hypothetical protein JOS77_30825 [Chromobacterium haemolyticum]